MDNKFAIWCLFVLRLGPMMAYWIDEDVLTGKRSVRECQAPPFEIASVTLDKVKDKSFPKDRYRKALKNRLKGLNNFLDGQKERLDKIKSESPLDYYPACRYKTMCKESREVAKKRRVLNSVLNCWNIQSVLWITCEPSLVEDFSCTDKNVTLDHSYICLPQYARQLLWVYCDTPDDPLRLMYIYVPFKCSVYAVEKEIMLFASFIEFKANRCAG